MNHPTHITICDASTCRFYREDMKGHCNLVRVSLDTLGQCSAYQLKDRIDLETEADEKQEAGEE